MTTETKTTSLDRIIQALTIHGWAFTSEPCEVMVPDTTQDIAPMWQRRARHPRVPVPGVRVKFSNTDVEFSRHSVGERVDATLYFTEAGAYVSEMTRGAYPVKEKMPVKDVEKMLALHAPERQQRLLDERKAANKAKHEQAVAEAQRAAGEAQSVAFQADAEAVTAVTDHIPGITRAEASRILAALEADERITAAREARHNLHARAEAVLRAQNDLASSARNAWSW